MTFMAIENTEVDPKRLLQIAFKEHYRCWLAGDAEDYHQIKDEGEITAHVLRRIAKRYFVNRGILRSGGTNGDDPVGKKLAEILTTAAPRLAGHRPKPILDRWDETRRVAEDCRKAMKALCPGKRVDPIVSGVTKLTWFLAPHGWTMFDSFAGKAVGVGQRGNAEERAGEFYGQLSSRGFCDHVNDVQEVLNCHCFGYLFAERVIDKFLMLVGRPDVVDEWEFGAKQFIAALRQPLGHQVRSCAESVARLAD